jgi:lysyl-tRNA synthetase class 2
MTEAWWHPRQFHERKHRLVSRGRIVGAIRQFFVERGFVEVETPALQVSPGLEPHLTAFATELFEPGEGARDLYLHTSPEFAMKKLLAAGVPKIFQLSPGYSAYRNVPPYVLGAPSTPADCPAFPPAGNNCS